MLTFVTTTNILNCFIMGFFFAVFGFTTVILVCIWAIRRQAQWYLKCTVGLPTVLWRPKFWNYFPDKTADNEVKAPNGGVFSQVIASKMNSTSITSILKRMERLNGPYGMYATVYGLNTKVIHVAHPIPAKAILQSCSLKAPGYDHFKNFCGEGVFTADGESWRQKRSSVVHALFKWQQRHHKKDPNNFTSLSNDPHPSAFTDQLEIESNHAAAEFLRLFLNCCSKGKPTDIVPLIQCATLNIIYRYLTHDKSNSFTQVEKPVNDEKASNSNHTLLAILPNYLQSILHIRMIILAQARSFWFLLPRIFYTRFSPMHTAEEQAMVPIRSFALLACLNAKPGSPMKALQSKESHGMKDGDVDATNLDDEVETTISKALKDEAITLLFAGQDTTAATLSWTLHLLSLYPDIQEKLALEVRTVLAQENVASSDQRYVPATAVSRMIYLDAVIKESMRLFPVAPFVVRHLDVEIPIPGTEINLPKGSFACIWIYGLHRNPTLWSEPDKFFPERWLNSHAFSADEGMTSGAYMPFAAGPRMCLGQPIAKIVLRIMLARIVSEIVLADDDLSVKGRKPSERHKDMQAGFTVLPEKGVWLTGVRRS
jgi:cytochrome P450